jgi:response regulator RpfG family c-di-GMP phosphodiesterase
MVLRKPDRESSPPSVRKPIVLVVDDDLETLSALRRSLRSESYNLLSTDDPFQALEWVKSGLISLVITDEFMPVMLGTELLEAVHRASPDTATVLLTGYPKPAVMFRGIQQRVDLMLAKPWTDQALRESALRLLREQMARGGGGKTPNAVLSKDRIKEP